MRIITGKHFARRTFLGDGRSHRVALAGFDGPAFAADRPSGTHAEPLLFTYIPIGAIMDDW